MKLFSGGTMATEKLLEAGQQTWALNKIFLHQLQQPGHIGSLLCGQLIKEQL